MSKTKWLLDPTHSELGFKIKHLMITNVSGSFKNFNAAVETREEDFSTAQIKLTAEMASIFTNNEQRDNHLRTSDFFEVEKYPELKFKSTKVEKIDSDTFALYGELTLKGVTKPVKLNVEFNGVQIPTRVPAGKYGKQQQRGKISGEKDNKVDAIEGSVVIGGEKTESRDDNGKHWEERGPLMNQNFELGKINEAIMFLEDTQVHETAPFNTLLEGCCNAGEIFGSKCSARDNV